MIEILCQPDEFAAICKGTMTAMILPITSEIMGAYVGRTDLRLYESRAVSPPPGRPEVLDYVRTGWAIHARLTYTQTGLYIPPGYILLCFAIVDSPRNVRDARPSAASYEPFWEGRSRSSVNPAPDPGRADRMTKRPVFTESKYKFDLGSRSFVIPTDWPAGRHYRDRAPDTALGASILYGAPMPEGKRAQEYYDASTGMLKYYLSSIDFGCDGPVS